MAHSRTTDLLLLGLTALAPPMGAVDSATAFGTLEGFRFVDEPLEFAGAPTPVGAGARGLALAGAFTAIADDATANTWNPAGLAQLERSEVALSLSWSGQRVDTLDGSGASGGELALDHFSFAYPFHAFGTQQTISVSWQRKWDLDRSWRDTIGWADGSSQVVRADLLHTESTQTGDLSAWSLSWGAEPFLGVAIGGSVNFWHNGLTSASSFEVEQRQTAIGPFWLDIAPITIETPAGVTVIDPSAILAGQNASYALIRQRFEVERGISLDLGVMWRVTPSIQVAFVYKPAYDLRLNGAYEMQRAIVRVDALANGPGINIQEPVWQLRERDLTLRFPPSASFGAAWRIDDLKTLALDIHWTRWRLFRVQEREREVSAINELIDANSVPDGWSVRLGYEHILIHPRLVSAWRFGLLYERLPGLSRVPFLNEETEILIQAKTDEWFGVAAGFGIARRDHLIDFGAQLRHGSRLGAGRVAPATETVDLWQLSARVNYTYHF